MRLALKSLAALPASSSTSAVNTYTHARIQVLKEHKYKTVQIYLISTSKYCKIQLETKLIIIHQKDILKLQRCRRVLSHSCEEKLSLFRRDARALVLCAYRPDPRRAPHQSKLA